MKGKLLNPKKVFYYDGDTFSMGKSLYDWPGIAGHFGIDVKLCGPVQCSMNKTKPADFNCMDPEHRHAARPCPASRLHTHLGRSPRTPMGRRTRRRGLPLDVAARGSPCGMG